MGDSPNKQIVINPDLHRRLRIHVATLGIPSIKGYVETLIEHAIATGTPPEVIGEPEVVEPETEIVGGEPEVVGEPEVIVAPVIPIVPELPQAQVVNHPDSW